MQSIFFQTYLNRNILKIDYLSKPHEDISHSQTPLTFVRCTRNILLHHLGDLIIQHHAIQGPSLVRTRDLLSHGGQETSWVEEASHPETRGTALEEPRRELRVTVEQVGEPETEGGRLPGDLNRNIRINR